jgi:hypothetical protein
MLTGKNPTEHGKTSGASANGATSQRYVFLNLNTICSCGHPSICISNRFGVSVCSGDSGSESSSEGSEGNSQNVKFRSLIFVVYAVYTRLVAKKKKSRWILIGDLPPDVSSKYFEPH